MKMSHMKKIQANLNCELCSKVCISRHCLSSHISTKQKQAVNIQNSNYENENEFKKLLTHKLRTVVIKSVEKLSSYMCFPEVLRSMFSNQKFLFSADEARSLWCNIMPVINSYNDIITTNTLLTEVVNQMIVHLSGSNVESLDENNRISISDKETKCFTIFSLFRFAQTSF